MTPTELPLLVLCHTRKGDTDSYTLHQDTRKILKDRLYTPSCVTLERDPQGPGELNELQRDALVEILTGLREGEVKNYAVEVWQWDDRLIEKWR